MFSLVIFVLFIAASCSERRQSFDCGRVTPEASPLVVGGVRARHGELPWHVAIYLKTSSPYRQICGGTIVARRLVISAVHCFWSPVEQLAPASRYAVAAGKVYKPWDETHDYGAQKSDVSELVVPRLFRGVDRNFAEDIALLLLARRFQYKPYLRPACLDFGLDLEERQMRAGSKGKVAGWGLTSAEGQQTTLLQVVELPVVDSEECLRRSPQTYWEYITADKICAGYDSGKTSLCQGDSGGGLVFPELTSSGEKRYYLRGVVSTSPSSTSRCNTFAITSFTKVSAHREFIQRRYQRELHEDVLAMAVPLDIDVDDRASQNPPSAPTNKCVLPDYPKHGRWKAANGNRILWDVMPGSVLDQVQLTYSCDQSYVVSGPSVVQSCVDGVWLHEAPVCKHLDDAWDGECGRTLVRNQLPDPRMLLTTLQGELPWRVDIYLGISRPALVCGGTILSSTIVVTAGSCFDSSNSTGSVEGALAEYQVLAGALYLARNNRSWRQMEDDGAQRRFIRAVRRSGEGGGGVALVELSAPLRLSERVKPVCLHVDGWPGGAVGKIGSWMTVINNSSRTRALRTEIVTSRSRDACLLAASSRDRHLYTGDKFCAVTVTNHTKVCDLQAGSGVAVPATEHGATRYYLEGIVAQNYRTTEPTECLGSLHLITNITEYEDFLRRNIQSESTNTTSNKTVDGSDNGNAVGSDENIDLTPAISDRNGTDNISLDQLPSDSKIDLNPITSDRHTTERFNLNPLPGDSKIDLNPITSDRNRSERSFDLNASPSVNNIDLNPTAANSNSRDRNDGLRGVSNAAIITNNTAPERSITLPDNVTQSLQIRQQMGTRTSPPPPRPIETATTRRNTASGPSTTTPNAAIVGDNTASLTYANPNVADSHSLQRQQTGIAEVTLKNTRNRIPAVEKSNLLNQNSNSLRGGSNVGVIPKTANFDATNTVPGQRFGASTPLQTYTGNYPSPARTDTLEPTFNPSLVRTNPKRRLLDNYNPSAMRDVSAGNPLNVDAPFQTEGNIEPVPVFFNNRPMRNFPQANFDENIRNPQDFENYIATVKSRFQQELINERLRAQAMNINNGYVPPAQVEFYRRALEAYPGLNTQNDPDRNSERLFMENMAREQFGGPVDPMMLNQNQAPFMPTRIDEHSSRNVACFNGQCSERHEETSCVNGQCSGSGFDGDSDYVFR